MTGFAQLRTLDRVLGSKSGANLLCGDRDFDPVGRGSFRHDCVLGGRSHANHATVRWHMCNRDVEVTRLTRLVRRPGVARLQTFERHDRARN